MSRIERMPLNLRIRLRDWLRTSNGRGLFIAVSIVSFLLLLGLINQIFSPTPQTGPPAISSSGSDQSASSSGSNEAAIRELKTLSWVKDTYVSPGYMNVGVIKSEKDWDSPMIGMAVCGILKRNSSSLSRVRFVDIEKVVREQVPAQSAEISVHYCK